MNYVMALKRAVLVCSGFTTSWHSCLLAAASADFGGLFRQQDGLDVRQNAALCDCHARQKLVQLLVVSDGELQMTRDDSRLLVVSCGVAGQLEHFSSQILHDGRQIDGSAGANSFGVVAFAQQTMDTTNGELKSCSARTALRLSLDFASFATSRHDEIIFLF